MKKLTKDCYVDVAGWTEGEVQNAAKVFARIPGCFTVSDENSLGVRLEDWYQYLMVLEDGAVFVGCERDIESHGRYIEVTKEDIFNQEGQSVKEFKEGDRVMFANERYSWFGDEFIVVKEKDFIVDVAGCDNTTYNFMRHNLEIIEEYHVDWNGKGFPPIGTVCEISNCGNPWEWCEVLFMGTTMCVVNHHTHSEQHYHLSNVKFRITKPEEEIFAEELQKDVQEMTGHGISDKMVRTLYVLNYRKQS